MRYRDPALVCEHRPDRPYDSQDPGHVIHVNGTVMSCEDRVLSGALTRAVLELMEAA